MPRLPRLDTPGSRHHVMNRGARKATVFLDDACRAHFLGLLSELPDRFGVLLHGYAIMPNHFHALLTAGRQGLGPAMAHLQGSYSRWLNGRSGWDGPVWRSRYTSRVVPSEDYWRHLLAYVHLNPVADGFVDDPGSATWTSHRFYSGEEPAPDWLSTAEHLALYGSSRLYLEYLAELDAGVDVAPDGYDFDQPAQGGERVAPPVVERPRKKRRKPATAWPMTDEAAWAVLEHVTGTTREAVTDARRGRSGNPRRWLALWWLPVATNRSASSWARELGISRSVFTQARERLAARLREDLDLAAMYSELRGVVPYEV